MSELVLRDSILIHAPLEQCFALSIRIDVVQQTLGFTPAPATGSVSANSRVLWHGRLFGISHQHHTLITAFDPPNYFQDSQERGRFAHFHHDHFFTATPQGTVLRDEVHFALPWYLGGNLVAHLVMKPHIQRLLRRRFLLLKQLAEE